MLYSIVISVDVGKVSSLRRRRCPHSQAHQAPSKEDSPLLGVVFLSLTPYIVHPCIFSLLRLRSHSGFSSTLQKSLEDQPDDDEDDADAAGGESAGGGEAGNAREGNMKPCEFCRRPFRKERLAKHEEACRKKAKAIGQFVCRCSFGSACRSSPAARGVGLFLAKNLPGETIQPERRPKCHLGHVALSDGYNIYSASHFFDIHRGVAKRCRNSRKVFVNRFATESTLGSIRAYHHGCRT